MSILALELVSSAAAGAQKRLVVVGFLWSMLGALEEYLVRHLRAACEDLHGAAGVAPPEGGFESREMHRNSPPRAPR